jgi:hypothetical protein
MALRKASDDLREITLAAIPGLWSKLLYFAKMRLRSGGKYAHWGFENRYGKQAEPAMQDAHAGVYREVLRTPVSELLEDAVENKPASDVLMSTPVEAMLPPQAESAPHFHYLVATLEALLKRRKQQP